MKYNKGFIGIGMIIAIVVALVIGGGAVYFTTKTPIIKQTQTNTESLNKKDYVIALNQDNKLIFIDINSKKISPINIENFMSFLSSNYIHDYDFSFSPDKKSFLVIKNNNIFKVDTETLIEKQLTFQGIAGTKEFFGIEVSHPKWAPDGKYIYFTIADSYSDIKNPQKHKMEKGTWIMNEDGSQQKYLSKISYSGWYPIGWLANSKEIVFNDSFSSKLYNIETEKIRNFSDKKIKTISFSKNGEFGFYITEDSMDNYLIDSSFNVIDNITRQQDQFPTNPINTNYTINFWEARIISPNGQYVIVTKMIQPYEKGNQLNTYIDNEELYLWNVKTKEKIKLPIFIGTSSKVFWNIDSNKIIFTRPEKLKPGNPLVRPVDIYTYNIKDQKEERITNVNNLEGTFIDY